MRIIVALVGLPHRPRPRAAHPRVAVSIARVKGVILAGGSGTRLHPLTRITNKHLLPLFDRPMVNYAVEALVEAGITELMLVTGGTHAGEFFRLLGNGREYGLDLLTYGYQERRAASPRRSALAEHFVARDKVCVMLADNVFERSLQPIADNFERQDHGGRIVLSVVEEAEHLRHLGVAVMDGRRSVRDRREARVAAVQVRRHRHLLLRRAGVGRHADAPAIRPR